MNTPPKNIDVLEPQPITLALDQNEVHFTGRLASDPSIRSAVHGKMVVHLEVSIRRRGSESQYPGLRDIAVVPVTAVYLMDGFFEKGLRKGSLVAIDGRLVSDTWKTPSGLHQWQLKVLATQVEKYDDALAAKSFTVIPAVA